MHRGFIKYYSFANCCCKIQAILKSSWWTSKEESAAVKSNSGFYPIVN